MKKSQTTCDPQRIELFLRHELSEAEQTAFELHLDECADCRRRLEATAARDDIWSGVRDALLGQQSPPDCLPSGSSALESATGRWIDSTDPRFRGPSVDPRDSGAPSGSGAPTGLQSTFM